MSSTFTWADARRLEVEETDRVGRSPKPIRSLWTAVDETFIHANSPIFWSDGTRGELRPGVMLSFFDVASNSSLSNTYMPYHTSDTSRLLVQTDSDRTLLIGSWGAVEHTPTISASNQVWSIQTGTKTQTSVGEFTVPFDEAFAVAPTLTFTLSDAAYITSLSEVTAGGFTSKASSIGVAFVTVDIQWSAQGPISETTL